MSQYPEQPRFNDPNSSPPTDGDGDDEGGNGARRTTSGMAIAAMILGIVGVVTSCVVIGAAVGLVGLILGIISLNKTGDPPFAQKGKGFAITGIALGGVALALGLIAPILIGILLPALGAARRTARQMQNGVQLRGIQQAMVTYAQGNKSGGGFGFYPGLDKQGKPKDLTVSGRLKLLLDGGYFAPDYVVSPQDSSIQVYSGKGKFTANNTSYALLDISEPGGRRNEWRDTINTQAIVLSDRNTGTKQKPASIWTEPKPTSWHGSVGRNDNSTDFNATSVFKTNYDNHLHLKDKLFQSKTTNDALMIHKGK